MSQVIVTDDKLNKKRKASGDQEHKIDREGMYNKWRRNDITGRDPLTMLIGLAVSPIWALWTALTALIFAVLYVLEQIFKGLGKIFGGKKSLITGQTKP